MHNNLDLFSIDSNNLIGSTAKSVCAIMQGLVDGDHYQGHRGLYPVFPIIDQVEFLYFPLFGYSFYFWPPGKHSLASHVAEADAPHLRGAVCGHDHWLAHMEHRRPRWLRAIVWVRTRGVCFVPGSRI